MDLSQPANASPPSSIRSGRKGSKKVRTGCITCKIRKVKCDETRPSCHRCTNTGRKCDGYLPDKSERQGSQFSQIVARLSSPSPLPDLNTDEEQHSFHFYRSFSSVTLSADVDTSFWTGLVPRLCYTERVVRHAVLALSNLHEALHAKPDLTPTNALSLRSEFAIHQYGKAITHLREWQQPQGSLSPVPLVTCILFICIEFMLRNESGAQLHIKQGRHILSHMDTASSSSIGIMIRQELVPIYTRLGLASFLFGTTPATIPPQLRGQGSIPASFSSLADARLTLYALIDDGLRFTKQAKVYVYARLPYSDTLETLAVEQRRLLSELNKWYAALAIFIAANPGTNAKILHLYYHTSIVWMSTALSPLETTFDGYASSFASIITVASEIIHARTQPSAPPQGSPKPFSQMTFSFETEVIPPLYFTSVKCRHPLMRRAALDLLCHANVQGRQENLWDAGMVAAVGARVIEIEEAGQVAESPPVESGGSDYEMDADTTLSFSPPFTEPKTPNASYPDTFLRIPIDAPPSIPPEIAGVISEITSNTSSPSNFDSLEILDTSGISVSPRIKGIPCIEPPYNVPEHARVKNSILWPKTDHGTWVRFFTEPDSFSDMPEHWKVTKEFVKRSNRRH